MNGKYSKVLSGAVYRCTESIFRFCLEQCSDVRKISIFRSSVLMSKKYI